MSEGTPNYGPGTEVRRPARRAGRGAAVAARAQPTWTGAHLPYPRPRQVSVRSMFAGKRGILFAVPGAFTPGCSKARTRPRRPLKPRRAVSATP